jgi:5-methylcytosine-specific restriction endonuclease McrA
MDGTTGGPRAGKSFTSKGKKEIDAANASNNGGANKCMNCGTDVVPADRSEAGVRPPGNERQRDHIIARSKGGDGDPSNGQILCRDCNLRKSDR